MITILKRMPDLARTIKKIMMRIRFGKITEEVKSVDGGVVSEIAYYGRGKLMIGYFAYGCFDPSMPYQG